MGIPPEPRGSQQAARSPPALGQHAGIQGSLPAPCQCPGSPDSSRPLHRFSPAGFGQPRLGGARAPSSEPDRLHGESFQHRLSPSLNPSLPGRLGLGAGSHGGPQPLFPCSPGGCGGPRAGVSDAAVGSDAAGSGSWEQLPAGSGRFGSAAAWESPTQSQGCSGSQTIPVSPGAVTLSRMQGRESRRWKPRAEPRGWTGGRWPGVGVKALLLAEPRGWQGWDSSALPVANSP